MSKISEYLKACDDWLEKERDSLSITLEEFANQIGNTPEYIIDKFKEAGLAKTTEDSLSVTDKEELLAHLRGKHGIRRKVEIQRAETEFEKITRAVAAEENGAEWEALRLFGELIIGGHEIDPLLQRLVNLIIARSFVSGTLPSMRRGRPKSEKTVQLGEQIARAYWDMRDSGVGYTEATAALSAKYHKEVRHISRMVEKHKSAIGTTLEERNRKRKWEHALRNIRIAAGAEARTNSVNQTLRNACELPPELAQIQFENEDYLEHLKELIDREAAGLPPLTRNVVKLMPVTDSD
ncbi:hypothetical protein [Roseateles sp.]|uniref:hypothetical protein n=1 Tax=Roseateles sp. TaxID=1971397 RepID=UPI003BA40F0C